MSNDLIQKNAELGRFLFCERYTLQPVKNSLYIAKGQDLKRGAVVDVNGVLVGTNSLMPYAVLENDCDTRAKGDFASVFVKGEFNIDKLFFADGLSKNDLDNIVYNGSGLGIVIKPYEYAEDFSPLMAPSKSNPLMTESETESMINDAVSEVTLDPSAVALGNVHLLDEVNEFPADGCILIDSKTNGPGEMSKDTLLELTAQNALAGNVAPAFDPTKPNDAGGYAYYKDDVVAYNGATYKFKVNHSSGAWNAGQVDRYDVGENLKFFLVTDNPEYLYAITDKEGRFLFGIKADGSFCVGDKAYLGGSLDLTKEAVSDISKALKDAGFTRGFRDFSDCTEFRVAHRPKIAVVNFVGIANMPKTKTTDASAKIEWWDDQGNYWKKDAVLNAQGQSTLAMPKKNIALDLLNSDGSSFKLKIGDMVEQDSFHLKAYYVDFFRGVSNAAYDLVDEIWRSRGVLDAPWKKALVQQKNFSLGLGSAVNAQDLNVRLDTDARCHPLGFPCVVLLNGKFYGVFAWSLKKHRDNYHMKKDNYSEIHLDGVLTDTKDGFWGGYVDWTRFEIRNPKKMVLEDGTNEYDGDAPQEIIGTDSPSYDPSVKVQKNTAKVKTAIERLSGSLVALNSCMSTYGIDSDEFDELFREYFDVDNLIDFVIFTEVIGDLDVGGNNLQWVTYDGLKWWACPYDLDRSYGSWNDKFDGVRSYHTLASITWLPFRYILSRTSYNNALESRYAELRNKGIISLDNMFGAVKKQAENVGYENYKKEYEKWIDSPSNRGLTVDSHWKIVVDADGNPVMGESRTWSENTSYVVGDTCCQGYDSVNGYYTFECVENSTGNNPVIAYGNHDSLWRIYTWIEQNIAAKDIVYNYQN